MKKTTANFDEIISASVCTFEFHPYPLNLKFCYQLPGIGLEEPYFVYEVISLYEGSTFSIVNLTLLVKRVR